MAHLVKCMECGYEVSSESKECPKCKTKAPHGISCWICTKKLPYSQGKYLFETSYLNISKEQAIYEENKRERSVSRGKKNPWGHPECLTKLPLIQIPLCPVCKKSNTLSSSACDKCGHERDRELNEEIVACRYCGFEINRRLAIKISNKVYYKDHDNDEPKDYVHSGGGNLFCHKECYAFRHPSSCFIATAAFGSPLAPEVQTLRNFRDDILRNYLLGQQFIELYERISPPIANIIAQNNSLRYLTRCLIVYPATWVAKLFLH